MEIGLGFVKANEISGKRRDNKPPLQTFLDTNSRIIELEKKDPKDPQIKFLKGIKELRLELMKKELESLNNR